MFTPLFNITKQAPLLGASLATPELGVHFSQGSAIREKWRDQTALFQRAALGTLWRRQTRCHGLARDITQDRTPEIREYLMSELRVEELDPERITRRLTGKFFGRAAR